MRSHRVDDVSFVDSQGATWSAEHKNKKLRLPVVSIGGGSGTSAADAIIVDSDEDISGVSSLPRTDTPKELPINHDAFLGQDVIDSDIELLESKAEDDPVASYHSPRELSPAEVSDMSSDPVALCGLRSDDTDVTTSDSEVDAADKEANDAEDIDGSRISARHAKPPSLPSLKPIRKLLAGRQRRGDPERDILPEGIFVAPGLSQKQGRREFLEEAPAITSSENDEESDCRASDPQLKRVPLPKTEHGRARRLLMPESAELPLVAVTMRGDCHFIQRKGK